jgi:serine/threonine protein kinase
MSLQPKSQLGHYQILSAVGAGGMGKVYRAQDPRLNRTVAIKVLSEEIATKEGFRERFEREAQAIAALSHPHICVIHDVGLHEGTHFIVMEYLEGQSLAERIESGTMPFDETIRVATQIAEALALAHARGIVHRDLKPVNIMLTKSGAKLLDFGLAKLREIAVSSMSMTGVPTDVKVTAQGTRTSLRVAKRIFAATYLRSAPSSTRWCPVRRRLAARVWSV